ncbi:MAG: flagellar protein FlgN [Negativicutes bacterium]|nr:flagellar protein FlgN [Negativicutes bacterium]
MKENWDRFIALLAEMVDLYRVILELSMQKRELLVAAKTKDLELLTQKEERVILQIGKLESARGKLARQIAAEHGLDGDGLTLPQLRELTEPETASKLEEIAIEFGKIMGELASVNQLNTELIQQALSFVNYNINLLTRSTVPQTYAARGQGNQETQSLKLVDRRV